MKESQPQLRRGTPDFLLLFLTLLFVGFGLVMVFNVSSTMSVYQENPEQFNPWAMTQRQLIYVGGGLIGMFVMMNIPYHKLRKLYVPFFLLILPVLALTPFIAEERKGARSWIDIGGFATVQPSEFAKLALLMYLAAVISKRGEQLRDLKKGLLPVGGVVVLFAALIMLQGDLGSTLILVASSFLLLLVGGARLKHLITAGLAGLVAVTLLILKEDYRVKRFTSFLNPMEDRLDSGFQLANSLIAFGHGGFGGVGLGKSIQKLLYIPEAHNDFIFAIIGEEFGFIGTSLFLLSYLLFIWRGILVSLRSPEPYSMLLGVGIMGWFGIQTLVNIGGVTGSMPLTGVTLPLISSGGSSIVVTLAGIGIVLGISRYAHKPDKAERTAAAKKTNRWARA